MSTETRTNTALKSRRKLWLAIVAGACVIVGAGYVSYWATVLRYTQSTDDAYVNGNIVQITPQISGTVISISADDTQFVKAGQPLVRLDQADAKVALDQAESQLAKTVREVRNLFATTGQLQAAVQVRETDLAQARNDLGRREQLGKSGAVSGEELQHARDAVKAAQSALQVARQQLAADRARVDNTTLQDHPDVRNAAAAVRNAYLNYARTVLPAPVSGFIARRNVQLGQRVGPGAPLMAVVPLDQVWVDANFKEPQLARMRIGQPVMLTADLYGKNVHYHGKVAGFGAGTGSAFSLLPAQNATGNWIKIVQRVPVRVALDRREIAENPLQIGLTMKAEVEVRNEKGERLPQLSSNTVAYSTNVFHSTDESADARVQEIIAANDSRAVPVSPAENGDGERKVVGASTDRLAGARVSARATPVALHIGPVTGTAAGRFQ